MIEKGSIQKHLDEYPNNRGWIIGEFLEKDNPLYNQNVQVKWVNHRAGDCREGSTSQYMCTSIDIVLSGKCRFSFPSNDLILELDAGEYVTYDTSLCTHAFEAITDCHLIVIRTPIKNE